MHNPVHVLYGGAHLFRANTVAKLGQLALKALQTHAPWPAAFDAVFGVKGLYPAVRHKLETQPVEDYRIDFEDGFGVRSEEEEDATAVSAAAEVKAAREAGPLPPRIGIRVKAMNPATRPRAVRTLERFFGALGDPPADFLVTLPKISTPEEVAELVRHLPGEVRLELMAETPAAFANLAALVDAGGGRVEAVHFGAYDFLSLMGVIGPHQDLRHPYCDQARYHLQLQLSGRGLRLADGITKRLPLGDSPAVHDAWRRHADNITHSLRMGFLQSWDLHPAQLVARYAAVYAFFRAALPETFTRLKNFIEQAAQATRVGTAFDDAATARGLASFVVAAVDCGAIPAAEAAAQAGAPLEVLRSGALFR
jgi:citrate lyase beta subunit